MSDKPALLSDGNPAGSFALPDHAVVALSGRDALGFAQAQTMNDASALADGQWQWSGWLTPKGRVIALFALLRIDPETLWLLLTDAEPHGLTERLRRFVFRSKVAISVRADLHASGAFHAPASAQGPRLAGAADAGIELDLGGAGGSRTLRIGSAAAAEDADALARWRAFDLAHGLPRLEPSQAEHWTPQQLSLERLGAYSVKKGCYPGQEIVARTHFLGQAKRGLVLLETHAPVASGDAVVQGGAQLGSVASVAEGAKPLALGVLPLERGDAALEIAGQAATQVPISDGLAR